jgi:hypothetical protein
MDAKESVLKAKEYAKDLFSGENVVDFTLEELSFNDGIWNVTVGITRRINMSNLAMMMAGNKDCEKSYKIVKIDDESGEILSLKNWGTNQV